MAPVCCHFKMPLLPGIDRFHSLLIGFKDRALSLNIGRRDQCKHVHVLKFVTGCNTISCQVRKRSKYIA